MQYIYFLIRVSRKQRKSLPNFQVQIENPKTNEMRYVLDVLFSHMRSSKLVLWNAM